METKPALTPMAFDVLLGRVAYEWETRKRIFDLPIARIFNVSEGPDLSMSFLGRPAATPIGPAAGPHSQLTENIVLSWLGGSRLIELKTVQILDELEIGRPCIDMQTIGYNIEWSQELKIQQSLDEYVKAWMMIDILSGWDELKQYLGEEPGPHIFDISVGYDLAGISTPEVAAYIDSMVDATEAIDRFRPLIPEPFATMADVHRLCGRLPDDADQLAAPDNKGKGEADSARRLARMLGRDVETADMAEWKRLALHLAEVQRRRLLAACGRVLAPRLLDGDAPLVGAGIGRFLVRDLARGLGRPYVDFGSLVRGGKGAREWAARCAPAAAVALLAAGRG